MKTYKSTNMLEALLPTMKQLNKKHKNPINFLKTAWLEIAPEWAILAHPYMIKQKTLFLQTSSSHAMILQYKETELLNIAKSVVGEIVERIKIISI